MSGTKAVKSSRSDQLVIAFLARKKQKSTGMEGARRDNRPTNAGGLEHIVKGKSAFKSEKQYVGGSK